MNNKNINLNIIGSGRLLAEIQEKNKDNKNIKILGQQNKDSIKKYLIESDCLIVPSFCYENSPTVIYEAKNFNLPIIASDIGGIPELINNDQGLLFKSKDEKDLVAKINEFIYNKERFDYYSKINKDLKYLENILKKETI